MIRNIALATLVAEIRDILSAFSFAGVVRLHCVRLVNPDARQQDVARRPARRAAEGGNHLQGRAPAGLVSNALPAACKRMSSGKLA